MKFAMEKVDSGFALCILVDIPERVVGFAFGRRLWTVEW